MYPWESDEPEKKTMLKAMRLEDFIVLFAQALVEMSQHRGERIVDLIYPTATQAHNHIMLCPHLRDVCAP